MEKDIISEHKEYLSNHCGIKLLNDKMDLMY